jgi:multimeric flavodoxin WrbA
MKFLVLSGNPKNDGLCHSITEEVLRGAHDGGAQAEILKLERLERCHVCGTGWGACREKNRCAYGGDGFDAAQDAVRASDLICMITPVYWAEMAEALKCFCDRFRRCESAIFTDRSDPPPAMAGKQVLLIASPGGSGNGMLTCLDQMDRFCRHTGAIIYDYIGINRWNNDYKRAAAYAAAKTMAEGRRNGETVSIEI